MFMYNRQHLFLSLIKGWNSLRKKTVDLPMLPVISSWEHSMINSQRTSLIPLKLQESAEIGKTNVWILSFIPSASTNKTCTRHYYYKSSKTLYKNIMLGLRHFETHSPCKYMKDGLFLFTVWPPLYVIIYAGLHVCWYYIVDFILYFPWVFAGSHEKGEVDNF